MHTEKFLPLSTTERIWVRDLSGSCSQRNVKCWWIVAEPTDCIVTGSFSAGSYESPGVVKLSTLKEAKAWMSGYELGRNDTKYLQFETERCIWIFSGEFPEGLSKGEKVAFQNGYLASALMNEVSNMGHCA